ncbi:heme/copper-type cytochrome/quinol oxidase subunit 2 [Alkalibacillus filiformis]|uniref:Heme/copper-type cytochrome/quinol oxidase subunit 2 n=1 Tax=Alkalibacillus filiformis TaxID=200990 RepID=A0ABU0DPR8_9BACI|nr:hypothetical protein [Alkalibacillus filiformis]MDQ0350431.1 heme/copper-type cytochrome/quinol oxidase subunit 2 [Alkalibacillus filiformis]
MEFILFVLLLILILFVLNIVSSVWSYRDAKRKGKSNEYAMIVLFGTIFFPIIGFIVYLVIRND